MTLCLEEMKSHALTFVVGDFRFISEKEERENYFKAMRAMCSERRGYSTKRLECLTKKDQKQCLQDLADGARGGAVDEILNQRMC